MVCGSISGLQPDIELVLQASQLSQLQEERASQEQVRSQSMLLYLLS